MLNEHSFLKNKTVIFVGPLGNPSDTYLAKYDYVIRTNNFFGIDKDHLNSNRCDILLCNKLYTTTNVYKIIENLPNISWCVQVSKEGYEVLTSKCSEEQKNKIININVNRLRHPLIRKVPFLLSKFLIYLIRNTGNYPKNVHVIGIDFYKGKELKDFWPPGYMIKEAKKNNVLVNTNKHDIRSNRKFLQDCIKNFKWITCSKKVEKCL